MVGYIAACSPELHTFTDKQIALLQNFAAQAVIAMENARLMTETHEALEQQTATAEVLQVINSSPGDLTPVFDAMLDKATRLCEASFAGLATFDGECFSMAAWRAAPTALVEAFLQPFPAIPGGPLDRMVRGESIVQIADITAEEPYRLGATQPRAMADLGGARTMLWAALRKDDALIGLIAIYRQEVRPFTDKQIALLQNFAAQAVIAMENARLINETREALEQQTATAEVLQVINSSPGDLKPVFDAILEKAHTLCGAVHGDLTLADGDNFRAVAMRGLPEAFAEVLRRPFPRRDLHERLLSGFVQIADLTAAEFAPDTTDSPVYRAAIGPGGVRTLLAVPLRRDGRLLGYITANRQEVRPFTDKQIALLENFAAQAVIAMENARLLTETREALEQQTATAEVLQVINSSPGDLTPVFDAMLDKALNLCSAAFGVLWTYDGEYIHATAIRGATAAYAEFLRSGPHRLRQSTAHARLLCGSEIEHIVDLVDHDDYRSGETTPRALVELGGCRTALGVPLRKDGVFLGDFIIYRREVRPFTDRQIALLQNFAAQAVIAMENARLITETREALEQQTATAEVLQVINSSPGELTPVFDAMIDKARRLCDAPYGNFMIHDGERMLAVSVRSPELFAEIVRRGFKPLPNSPLGRLISGEPLVHIPDLAEVASLVPEDPVPKAAVELGGVRTVLMIPLVKDGSLLGVFTLYRQEVRPFTDKQIALLQNFAAQAVIAMENARLLDELRQRQAELRVTFDNMVDGVAMFDGELRLAAWNRNYQDLLHLPADFLAERHGFDEFVRYLTERGEFGETDPETEINRLRGRLHEHYQFERTRPDGTVIEVRHNPMPDGGVVMIYSDITERKRSEAEIRAARDAAEAAYRDLKAAQASLIQAEKMASLGQLTAGIAHEIKNPLNFVNNFADLSVELLDELKETAAPAIAALDDDKRTEIDETIGMLTGNLEKIAEHGRRADGIVKSMLEHSRGTSGERRSVDLNGLIEEALNLAYHGGRAQDASFNITLERDFAEAIAPIELVPQDITRVCLNLFGNGFYAATKRQKQESDPAFKPTLEVSTRDLGDAVEVRVWDNGVGITPEIRDKLFQPFFTTKPTGEGTGLGLSISYDIVTQQHGGTISVDSRVGDFTEFTIRLPRIHQTAMAEAAS
jgi:PAS domain S-box-containing protein